MNNNWIKDKQTIQIFEKKMGRQVGIYVYILRGSDEDCRFEIEV